MASTDDSEPEIPSYETLRLRAQNGTGPWPSTTTYAKRLYWTLQGPISAAVSVMDAERNPDENKEPLCQIQADGSPIWHSIAQEPFTTPEASSISVVIGEWEDYMSDWLDGHEPHAEPDSDNCEFGQLEEGGSEPELLRCCGTDRPREIPPLLVKASTKPYITVQDYVSAVHPWLLDFRDKLLWALSLVVDDKPLPAGTKMCVTTAFPTDLMIREEDEQWIKDARWSHDVVKSGRIAP